jgi:hypothetical protein
MKKLTIVSITPILCIMAIAAMAQEANTTSDNADGKTYTHVPFSLSFVPGISTSGFMGGDIITNCAFNIIAGHYAKLQGVEFGSILNWETEKVYGAQFSGVANIVEGNVRGFQGAGTVNYVGGHVRIGQLSGAINVALRDLEGVQTAGALNMTLGHVRGAQISVVNIGGDVLGAQVGVVNIARRVQGAQVGIVNFADEFKGAPIGIFSFVRKGQIHVDMWASETSAANIALKTGSEQVYSILALGYQPTFGDDPYRWSYGIGIGGRIPLGVGFANIEALSFHINEDEIWTEEFHNLNKLRVIYGWEIDPRFSIFAGATLNVFVSQFNDGDHISISSIYDRSGDDTWVRIWPGFVAGIQF